MITYAQAREAALAFLEPTWSPEYGTLWAAEKGKQDSSAYLVPWGAQEAAQGDDGHVLLDAPVILVDKETGEVTSHLLFDVWDRTSEMEPT